MLGTKTSRAEGLTSTMEGLLCRPSEEVLNCSCRQALSISLVDPNLAHRCRRLSADPRYHHARHGFGCRGRSWLEDFLFLAKWMSRKTLTRKPPASRAQPRQDSCVLGLPRTKVGTLALSSLPRGSTSCVSALYSLSFPVSRLVHFLHCSETRRL